MKSLTVRLQRAHQGGFTLMELVVVIAVLVALAALLVPAISSVMDDAKVSEVASLFDSTKKAATRHNFDTGRFAHEYTGPSYLAAGHHELSMEQSYSGWKGPYLEEPLNLKHNPWGGNVHLYNYLLVNGLQGWDLDRDGTHEHTSQTRACVLWMNQVPEEAAEQLDESLDTGTERDTDWRAAGRLQWRNGTLWILVFHKL